MLETFVFDDCDDDAEITERLFPAEIIQESFLRKEFASTLLFT